MGKTKVFIPDTTNQLSAELFDEHILLRIRGLQDTEKLEHLDVTYFDEAKQTHLQEVLDECQIKKYRLIKCPDFNFHI